MSTEANKAVIRRFRAEVFNRGNVDLLEEIVTPDALDHSPNPGQPPGIEGVKWVVRTYRAASPDFHMEPHDENAEGNKVVSRWTITGTHQGDLFGIPPTGKRVSIAGIDIIRVTDGMMAEHWLSVDQLGLLQQLGIIPTPGQGG
jgi:steroid delta-isomerase-like uncharacterized protein